MKIINTKQLIELINLIGKESFLNQLKIYIKTELQRWQDFDLSPRHSIYFDCGVIELMPCADQQFYTCKYVNGHPNNPKQHKLCVAALGLLSDVNTGYPLMLSDMTLLTAFRTAATSALAARYLARPDSERLAIIGCGAQSEFLVTAICQSFPIKQIKFYDTDIATMGKFACNMKCCSTPLIPCRNIPTLMTDNDIIITATAAKQHQTLFSQTKVYPGLCILAVGGDCPGKTELAKDVLTSNQIVVEYQAQTQIEGEIQVLYGDGEPEQKPFTELWQLTTGQKNGRTSDDETFIFDSVGVAVEDFATLTLLYQLAGKYKIGTDVAMIPTPENPKNLYGMFD